MGLKLRTVRILMTIAVIATACNSSTSDESTTTVTEAPLATITATDAPEPTAAATTTTSIPKSVLSAPAYRIVDRIPGAGSGDTVIVQLDPSSYGSLTDIDLYDLIAEVVELFPPVEVAHVVDSAAAVNVVANADASEADRQAITENYLARLDHGVQITYLGPFVASGTAVLGS